MAVQVSHPQPSLGHHKICTSTKEHTDTLEITSYSNWLWNNRDLFQLIVSFIPNCSTDFIDYRAMTAQALEAKICKTSILYYPGKEMSSSNGLLYISTKSEYVLNRII